MRDAPLWCKGKSRFICRVTVLPGDGTGPEVTREAVKVLDAAAQKFSFKLDYTDFDFGGNLWYR